MLFIFIVLNIKLHSALHEKCIKSYLNVAVCFPLSISPLSEASVLLAGKLPVVSPYPATPTITMAGTMPSTAVTALIAATAFLVAPWTGRI